MAHPPLTAQDVTHLNAVLNAASAQATVRWASETDEDEIRTGVARRVGPFDGQSQHDAPDVRDQYLHISASVELWLLVGDVVAMVAARTMIFGK